MNGEGGEADRAAAVAVTLVVVVSPIVLGTAPVAASSPTPSLTTGGITGDTAPPPSTARPVQRRHEPDPASIFSSRGTPTVRILSDRDSDTFESTRSGTRSINPSVRQYNATVEDDWPMFARTANRTGFIDEPGAITNPGQKWHIPATTVGGAPVIADLDRDGSTDVLYGPIDEGAIRALDGATGRGEQWAFPVESAARHPAVGDIDDDGDLEVVVGVFEEERVYALDADTGDVVWNVSTESTSFTRTAIADIDDDDTTEVVFTTEHTGLFAVSGRDGSIEWTFDEGNGDLEIETAPAVGDVDDDGILEIVFGSFERGMFALNGVDGSIDWRYQLDGPYQVLSTPALADVDGDDATEVVFGDSEGFVRSLDGTTGAVEWNHSLDFAVRTSPAVGDLDGDVAPEVAVALGGRNQGVYAVAGADGSREWYFETAGDPRTPAIADVNGDGSMDVVTTAGGRTVHAILGANGREEWAFKVSADGRLTTGPSLGDIDEDDAIEVVVGHENGVYAIDGTGQSGAPTTGGTISITGFSPNDPVNGGHRTVVIRGQNFTENTSVTLAKGDHPGSDPGTITGTVRSITSNRIVAELNLTSPAYVGTWDVVVETPDGDTARGSIFLVPSFAVTNISLVGVRGYPVGSWDDNTLVVDTASNAESFVWLRIEPPKPGVIQLIIESESGRVLWDSRNAEDASRATLLVHVPAGVHRKKLRMEWRVPGDAVTAPEESSPTTPNSLGDFVSIVGVVSAQGTGDAPLGSSQTTSVGKTGGATKDELVSILETGLINTACGGLGKAMYGAPTNLRRSAIENTLEEARKQTVTSGKEFFERLESELKSELEDKATGALPSGIGKLTECWNKAMKTVVKQHEKYLRKRCEEVNEMVQRDTNRYAKKIEIVVEQGQYNTLQKTQLAGEVAGGECTTPADDEKHFTGLIRGPWDPNDKSTYTQYGAETAVVDGSRRITRHTIPEENATDRVEYVIQFENKEEATAAARDVTITDVLDEDFDPETLEIIETSHPGNFSYAVDGGTVTFRFVDIDLPPNEDPPEGEGFVVFSVKPERGVPPGTEFRNNASIVFDDNPPIETGDVVHAIVASDVTGGSAAGDDRGEGGSTAEDESTTGSPIGIPGVVGVLAVGIVLVAAGVVFCRRQ